MKKLIQKCVKLSVRWVVLFANVTSFGRYVLSQLISAVMSRNRLVRHKDVGLTFAAPNSLNNFRIDTFSTKEPETLEWIDSMPEGSVIWDVGANVGLYTCYAAKTKGCRVFAFEPSVFNLELLARNIYLNGLSGKVVIVPLPLSDMFSFSTLNMTSTEWGGALSTFGQSYGQDGHALNKTFEFQTIGISMVDAMESLKIPQPDFIKMDVDGIEHLILKGGAPVLANIKGALIEINEEFQKQSVNSTQYLTDANLVLKEKRQSEMFKNSAYKNSYNQIWHRPC
jgi:FkbM family methyltransferase